MRILTVLLAAVVMVLATGTAASADRWEFDPPGFWVATDHTCLAANGMFGRFAQWTTSSPERSMAHFIENGREWGWIHSRALCRL